MKIQHIAIYVRDLEKSREFYCKYFHGLSGDLYHNTRSGFRSYFLTFEDGARLELMNKPGLEDLDEKTNRYGFTHLAFSVGSKEQVDILTKQLIGDGYEWVSGPRTTGDGYYESCILDPEGNLVEITL